MEFAGSLGDLGTLLPLAIGMILINGLNPVGLFVSVGLMYILTGVYFGVTVPIQPMKVIGAYAIATSLNASDILASSLLMAIFLLIIGTTGIITLIAEYTPKSVVRGIQLSTGALLMSGGVKFIAGNSAFQKIQGAAEPYLAWQSLGPVPIGLMIGSLAGLGTMLLLNNKRFPAALVVILSGFLIGLVFGNSTVLQELELGINLPEFMPFDMPGHIDFTFAFLALALPQLPMTLGNAVLAYTDLSKEYFQEKSHRVTNRSACISIALANITSFFLGGMPLCHGAGGLAAHYRFGARTSGSNLMIGTLFLLLACVLGQDIINLLNLLPLSVLGVLLLFSGTQLAMTIIDLNERKDIFVAVLILGITLASNLAAGFLVGIIVAWCLRRDTFTV
jgi:SulP family sulfate permease